MRRSAYAYFLFGLAALGSWWLVSQAPRRAPPTASSRPAPGYYFEDARLTETDATGQTVLTLHTRHAQQDVHSNAIQLQDIAVAYRSAPDAEWSLRADTGSMPIGADVLVLGGHVELRAIGTGNSAAVVHTDSLSVDRRHHMASTQEAALIDWPPQQIFTRGFHLDLNRRTLALENSVHGTFRR
jgi:LPS export ABC transporter protein LptC